MPHAPTMPMIVAERVLDSKKYRTWLARTGSTPGMSPKRIRWSDEPPDASTPSAGLRSQVSIASENSLPKAPKSEHAMASAPAKGPRPTTLIQISAQISTSTERITSRPRRTAKRAKGFGTTFRAARKATGKANSAAVSVPRKAMPRVSARAWRKTPKRPAALGGNISRANPPRRPSPWKIRAREKSRVHNP